MPLLCYKAIHTTLPVHSLKKYHTLCNFSLGADSQLPSLHAYSKAFVTVSFLDKYRNTDNDGDPFTESEDNQELEVNETVLEYC